MSQRTIAEKLMGRYNASNFDTPRRVQEAHYDRLREFGIGQTEAKELANRAIDKTLRLADKNSGGMQLKSSSEPARLSGKFRIPFDWEKT